MGDEASYLDDGSDYVDGYGSGDCYGECELCEYANECPDAYIP